jgi:hypothetical protein
VGWNEEEVFGRSHDVQRQAHPDEDTRGGYFVLAEVVRRRKKWRSLKAKSPEDKVSGLFTSRLLLLTD